MKKFCLIVLVFAQTFVYSQTDDELNNKLDSLREIISTSKDPVIVINGLVSYADLLPPTKEYVYEWVNVQKRVISLSEPYLKDDDGRFFLEKSLLANFNLGWQYDVLGKRDSAIYFFTQCEKLDSDSEDLNFKFKLNVAFGRAYRNADSLDLAIEYFEKAHDNSVVLQNDSLRGVSLANSALAHRSNHDLVSARSIYYEAIAALQKHGFKGAFSRYANAVGDIESRLGYFEKAEEVLIKGYNEATGLKNYSDQQRFLHYISNCYKDQMLYAKAEEYSIRAYELATKQEMPYEVARELRDIGKLKLLEGDSKAAMEFFEKSIDMYDSLNYSLGAARVRINLAVLTGQLGLNKKAISLYRDCKGPFRLSEANIELAYCDGNIGIEYMKLNHLDSAYKYLIDANRMLLQIGDSTDQAGASFDLALYFKRTGNYEKSIELAESALVVFQNRRRPEWISRISQHLYRLYTVTDSPKRSEDNFNSFYNIEKKKVNMNFEFYSEKEKELYLAKKKFVFDQMYSNSLRYSTQDSELFEKAFNESIQLKGWLLRSSTLLRSTILGSNDSTLITQYNDWLALRRRATKSFARGEPIEQLEKKINEIEKQLVLKSQEFADVKKVQELDWKDVQSGLQEGETAIEFVRFTHQEDYRNDSDKVELYAALIINRDSDHPKMIRLFEETELEKIIGTFPGNNLSYIEQVYGSKENTKSQLYDLIWKPMEEELKGAKKVYVSPVGLLHKISFAALAKEQDVYLCDNYEIEMMSSSGKLALQSTDESQESSDVNSRPSTLDQTTTLFGGINYNSDSTTTEHWQYLDGSLSETQQIEKILKKGKVNYNYYNQSTATEAQFKEIASNSNILHIATHGFFYPDPDLALEDFVDQEESEEPINFRGGRTGVGVSTFVKSRNPLMRSGLAFAGANDVWNRTNIEGEDGVLTAAEVATIDMRNTDLVVLSACETGLGDIKGSEGVYGLQRSFKMAGVKYLIMSLWQVPDKETAEFMTSFYKNLTKTNDIKKSFNLTQQEMRKKYDPYYWAAFVLVE